MPRAGWPGDYLWPGLARIQTRRMKRELSSLAAPAPPHRRRHFSLPEHSLRHLDQALRCQWRRYRKALERCQTRSSEKAVHDSRVATRRLLSLVELLQPFLSPGRQEWLQQFHQREEAAGGHTGVVDSLFGGPGLAPLEGLAIPPPLAPERLIKVAKAVLRQAEMAAPVRRRRRGKTRKFSFHPACLDSR